MTTQIPIVVLTLKGDAARRAPLLAQLDALGLRYELHYGIDGRAGVDDPPIDRAAIRAALFRDLTDGEIACALSHIAIWRGVTQSAVIVLEDDAIVGAPLAAFARATPPDIGLLLLDHQRAIVRRTGVTVGQARAYRLRIPAYLTTGYMIRPERAARMAADSLPLRGPADWPCDIVAFGAFALVPRIVDHPATDAGSTLATARAARPVGRRSPRFLRPGYWRDVWIKRTGFRVS